MSRIRTRNQASRIRKGIIEGTIAGESFGLEGFIANPFYGFNSINATIDKPANKAYMHSYEKALDVLANTIPREEWLERLETDSLKYKTSEQMEVHLLKKRVAKLEAEVKNLQPV